MERGWEGEREWERKRREETKKGIRECRETTKQNGGQRGFS